MENMMVSLTAVSQEYPSGAQLGILRGRGPNQKKGIPSFQSSDVIWDVYVCMCV